MSPPPPPQSLLVHLPAEKNLGLLLDVSRNSFGVSIVGTCMCSRNLRLRMCSLYGRVTREVLSVWFCVYTSSPLIEPLLRFPILLRLSPFSWSRRAKTTAVKPPRALYYYPHRSGCMHASRLLVCFGYFYSSKRRMCLWNVWYNAADGIFAPWNVDGTLMRERDRPGFCTTSTWCGGVTWHRTLSVKVKSTLWGFLPSRVCQKKVPNIPHEMQRRLQRNLAGRRNGHRSALGAVAFCYDRRKGYRCFT